MKIDNKGFAISSIMYLILVMSIILITVTLAILGNRKIILDKQKSEVLENIYDDRVYKDSSGALPPVLGNLTPVKYDYDLGSFKVADVKEKWYDYTKQEWANAVILEDGIVKEVDDELDISSEVKAMFVWIPRFSYTIRGTYGKGGTDAAHPGEIDIKFVNKTTKEQGQASYSGTITSEWYTHPAFTFGDKELSGFWVGKFETSHLTLGKNQNDLECTDINCENADGIRILPNVQSLRNNDVSNFFFAARSMSRSSNLFNINSNIVNTHMMKNSEWAAVAYLSQSKYGKYGNSDYVGENKEVYKNDSSNFITGKSSGKPSIEGSLPNGSYSYDEETNGTGASTTGNIYGIYDMSGGSSEVVMGNLNDIILNSGFDSTFFINNTNYYDKYVDTNVNNALYKGQALGETSGWYGDSTTFISSTSPWINRGGSYNNGTDGGMFNFSAGAGSVEDIISFRIALTLNN